MPFTNNAYCTLAQVKSALDITSTDAARDNWISGDLIPEAQAFIDNYCNRTWQTDGTVGSPATRYYSGKDRIALMIDECMSVSQVLETNFLVVLGPSGTFLSQGATTVDITADCVLLPLSQTNIGKPGWKLKRISSLGFSAGIQNYVVKGVFGNPTIPADITRACIRLCTHYVKMRDSNYAQMMSEQGGVREKFVQTVPDDIKELLNNYRRVIFVSRTGWENDY